MDQITTNFMEDMDEHLSGARAIIEKLVKHHNINTDEAGDISLMDHYRGGEPDKTRDRIALALIGIDEHLGGSDRECTNIARAERKSKKARRHKRT